MDNIPVKQEYIPSVNLINYIKSIERFESEAYLDVAGIPTIGYGTTFGVKLGQKISEKTASDILMNHILKDVRKMQRLIKVDLNQNQMDALVSFVYNVGVGSFSGSTLLKKLNNKDFNGAANEFVKWNKYKDPKTGKYLVSRGLTNRRLKEKDIFLKGFQPVINPEDKTLIDRIKSIFSLKK